MKPSPSHAHQSRYPDFGAHTQPQVLHDGVFYSRYTINERSDGLVAMSMDGQVKPGNVFVCSPIPPVM